MVLSFMISKKLIAGLFLALAGGFLTTSATAFRIRMDVVNKQQYRLSTTESEHTNVAVTTTKKLGLWESVMTAIGAKQRPAAGEGGDDQGAGNGADNKTDNKDAADAACGCCCITMIIIFAVLLPLIITGVVVYFIFFAAAAGVKAASK